MPISRRTRILLIVPAALLAGVLLLAAVVSTFYEQEVKQAMISQLNRHLRAEIKVEDFSFSLLHHFPLASFELKNVLIKEVANRPDKDTLLHAGKVSLLFNIMGIFKKDFTIRSIQVADGNCKLRIDAQGVTNYEFWTTDSASSSSDLDLSQVQLKNMQLSFLDRKHGQDYDMSIHQLSFSGRFNDASFTMHAKGDLFVKRLKVDDIAWIDSKATVIDVSLDVQTALQQYRVGKSTIRLADVTFSTGGVLTVGDETTMDLEVAAQEADLGSFLSLLPPRFVHYFKDFKSSGKFVFSSRIKGVSSDAEHPDVEADFSIRDGKLTPPGGDVSLERIELSGTLNTASLSKKGVLKIQTFTARLGANPVTADLKLEDLRHPFLTLHAATTIDLSAIQPFIANDTLETLTGEASMNISFAGKVSDLPHVNAANLYTVKSSGAIRFTNVCFGLKKNPLQFKGFNGELELQNADVAVKSLAGNIGSSDFTVDGRFTNFITFLLIPGQPADIRARLRSNHIDLDELLINNATTTSSDTAYKLKVNPRLVSDLEIKVDELKFRKFRSSGISGQLHLEDQVISGRSIRFNAMKGAVAMDAIVNVSRKDSILISCDAVLSKLDIHDLFYQLENFDQDIMTDKNVKGDLTATVQFRSSWTTDLSINPAKAKATCDLTIDNGALIDFGPIMELSKYLKLSDLNNIRFSTLKNVISISDEQIYIPSMEIKSSALNLTCSGVHTFENIIDYRITLLLSDVLGKKMKQQKSEFGEIEDDGLGRTKLFLTMKGPVDDPKIGYDRKAATEKIKTDIVQEKKQLKSMLHEEFGIFRKDSVKKSETPKKKKEEMQIEWKP